MSEIPGKRPLPQTRITCDLAVVGGGMAGVCCALTAARAGLQVTLIQDRPVLGGNASSEVRLWILGATSHMGNNNRWAREGGVIDEILVENMYRNREGNPVLMDALLLEKASEEPNLTLLLNTVVIDLDKRGPDAIERLRAFCPQNQTAYEVEAPLYCDASGDGILGFLAGAAVRMGAESRAELGEQFAPPQPTQEKLGHTIYFYSRDAGRPVSFVAPSFALKDVSQIARYRQFGARDSGLHFWWVEYGGHLDTVRESEAIKWELWRVVYGIWNHIKNSGKFPESESLTLEWVGMIPGKRESRRFEGGHILTQQDIIEQRPHADAVAHGGWAIDLHPVDGVYSKESPCTQWHARGVYEIPYRCLYSRNIENLFLAGRIISASHVAFGSTRVMATGAVGGQAVGMAAALCRRHGVLPRQAGQGALLAELQQELLKSGQHIPGRRLEDPKDLACGAAITASSRLRLEALPADGPLQPLDVPRAMLLPVAPGPMASVTFTVDVQRPTTLELQLRVSRRADNHTPDVTLATQTLQLQAGTGQQIEARFDAIIDLPRYAFVCLMANPEVVVQCSRTRLTGVLALAHNCNKAVAKSATQSPPAGIGVDTFEFWYPARRPGGHNFALGITPALDVFGPENVVDGVGRPTDQPHAWVAALDDPAPKLTLAWPKEQTIGRLELDFDTDYDHPMESLVFGHPEAVMPFCVRQFQIHDGKGRVLAACEDNHQSRRTIMFDPPLATDRLVISLTAPGPDAPASLFAVRCYERSRKE